MKRFQECNWLVKGWRYRHYLYIPFKWVYYQYISSFYITDDETFEDERVGGCMLWKLLIGIAQHDMKWYWTHEEVKKMMSDSFGESYDDEYDIDEETVEFYESPEVQDDDVIDDVRDDEYWKGID